MKDVFALLNMNAAFVRDFPLQAKLVHDSQIEKTMNSNIGKLKRIEELMLTDREVIAPKQSIDEVIKSVRRESKLPYSTKTWSTFELRILSYYMSQLHGDMTAYSYSLSLLSSNWRNMFFNGLVSYVLNSWNTMPLEGRDKTCTLIKSKLSAYTDHNRKYLALKNHANFFDANGPLRMATLMAHRSDPIHTAPTLIGYKETTFNLPYYSDVVINYIKQTKCDDVFQIEDILQKHSLDRTKKLILADLVEKADENGTEIYQTSIGHFANRVLGDISLPTTWAPFDGASAEEIKKLKNAKELVNKWYVRRVIDVFFDRCVQDPARKRFWMAYVPYIKDFRVAGSRAVRSNLENVERIKDMFANYFVSTDSTISKTAALILTIKNKVFVEFSDHGALYVYNQGHYMVSFIDKGRKYIDSTNSLKLTSLPVLVEQENGWYYFKEEGRVPHAGFWQKRLHSWMRKMLEISVVEDSSYDDDDDDDYNDTRYNSELSLDSLFDLPDEDDSNDEVVTNDSSYDIYQDFNTTIYEKDVRYYASSKSLHEGRCFIALAWKGFYLYINKRNSYAFLTERKDASAICNIWVKRPNYQDYMEIVHNSSDVSITVGFIKFEKDYAIFKLRMEDTKFRRINLT